MYSKIGGKSPARGRADAHIVTAVEDSNMEELVHEYVHNS